MQLSLLNSSGPNISLNKTPNLELSLVLAVPNRWTNTIKRKLDHYKLKAVWKRFDPPIQRKEEEGISILLFGK